MQPCVRIDNPALTQTKMLLEQVLLPVVRDEARVRFLCEPGSGEAVAQRLRVMLSRRRKELTRKGQKLRYFRLHSTIHPETHMGRRFDCVVMWKSVSETHIMTQELEDILRNG